MKFNLNESVSDKRRFWLYLVQEADGKSPATGEEDGQPQISKNGGPFSNTENSLIHIGHGTYYVELDQDELNTAGRIIVRYKSSNTLEFSLPAEVDPAAINTGTGLHSVEITIQEQGSNDPLPGVLVSIRNEAETSLIAWGVTDEDGKIGFSLDEGTFHVLIRSTPHYAPLPAQELEVSGLVVQAYSLTNQAPAPPPVVEGLARIFLTVIGLDGLPVPNIEANISLIVEGPAEVSADRFLTFFNITARTGSDGQLRDPKTQEVGALVLRSDFIFPHLAPQDKKWRVEVPQCRLTGAAAFEQAITTDTVDLGEVLGP